MNPMLVREGIIWYKFRSNSDLCLTGYLREMLPGVIAYGVQFDLNLHLRRSSGHSFATA